MSYSRVQQDPIDLKWLPEIGSRIDFNVQHFSKLIKDLLYEKNPDDTKISICLKEDENIYERIIDDNTCTDHDTYRVSRSSLNFFRRLIDFPPEKDASTLNPINWSDWYVNALRILQGVLLIAEHENEQSASDKLKDFVIKKYQEIREDYSKGAVADSWKASCFIYEANHIVHKTYGCTIHQAATQVLLARDNCMLLDNNPSVKTKIGVSEQRGQVRTVLTSTPQRVHQWIYDQHFYNEQGNFKTSEPWYVYQSEKAGIRNHKSSWLQRFYQNNRERILKQGNFSVASERYKPIPASYHKNDIEVEQTIKEGITVKRHASFLGVGTVVPIKFHMPKDNRQLSEQQRLAEQRKRRLAYAKDVLVSIMSDHLIASVEQFADQYKSLLTQGKTTDFYFNYSTLLTPFFWDIMEYDDENNNFEMIEMAKEALLLIEKEQLQLPENASQLKWLKAKYPNINIHFSHTNNQINRWSDTDTLLGMQLNSDMADYTDEDRNVYSDQLRWVNILPNALVNRQIEQLSGELYRKMLQYIKGELASDYIDLGQAKDLLDAIESSPSIDFFGCNDVELQQALVLRLRASLAMRMLLSGHPSFSQLSHDRRDLMKSGLSLHMMGEQSLEIRGCKSRRERYGLAYIIYAAQLEDKNALFEWEALEKKIPAHVRYGHNIANTSPHVAGCQKIWLLKKDYEQSCQDVSDASRANSKFIKLKPLPTFNTKLAAIKYTFSSVNHAYAMYRRGMHEVNSYKYYQRLPIKAAVGIAAVALAALAIIPMACAVVYGLYLRHKLKPERDRRVSEGRERRDALRKEIKQLKGVDVAPARERQSDVTKSSPSKVRQAPEMNSVEGNSLGTGSTTQPESEIEFDEDQYKKNWQASLEEARTFPRFVEVEQMMEHLVEITKRVKTNTATRVTLNTNQRTLVEWISRTLDGYDTNPAGNQKTLSCHELWNDTADRLFKLNQCIKNSNELVPDELERMNQVFNKIEEVVDPWCSLESYSHELRDKILEILGVNDLSEVNGSFEIPGWPANNDPSLQKFVISELKHYYGMSQALVTGPCLVSCIKTPSSELTDSKSSTPKQISSSTSSMGSRPQLSNKAVGSLTTHASELSVAGSKVTKGSSALLFGRSKVHPQGLSGVPGQSPVKH